MTITISKKTINTILLFILVLICMVFPNDFMGLKKISFIILLVFNIGIILLEIQNKTIYMFIGIIFPLALFIVSFIIRRELSGILGGVYCCTMILLVPIISNYDINYKKILMICSFAIATWTLIMLIGDMAGLFNVNANTSMREFIYNNNIGIMGKSSSYSFYYKIFIKTSPLVVFLLAYSLIEKRFFLCILSILALLATGTRANIGFSAICFLMYFCFNKNSFKRNQMIARVVTIAFVVGILILNFDDLYNMLYDVFITSSNNSDSVRLGHIQGLIESYKNNPFAIVMGFGVGSSYYSYSYFDYVTTMEWAYLDLLRQVGLIFFIPFMIFILYPFRVKNIHPLYKTAYAAYLLIAFTNPLLFSSTAFLTYVFMYVLVNENGGCIKNQNGILMG